MQRQFSRLIELLLLSNLSTHSTPLLYRAYRLQVKERLYRFNYEILAQVSPDERREKLGETYKNVEEDYKRILAGLEKAEQEGPAWEWVDLEDEEDEE